jgi:hypothetical protein
LFGSIWREAVLTRGYWDAEHVHLATPPVLPSYRRVAVARSTPEGSPVTILFPTEEFLRGPAIAFWHELLSQAADTREVHWRLRIKLHPGERGAAAEYAVLAERFPHRCSFVPAEVEAFEELPAADIVASYTSTMLIEAMALGIPTVALRGGTVPQGFATVFGLPELSEAMAEVDTPAELLALLQQVEVPAFRNDWKARTLQMSNRLFAWDAPDVADVVRRLA